MRLLMTTYLIVQMNINLSKSDIKLVLLKPIYTYQCVGLCTA
jgi:hypothetical protein